jgi:ribose 5-phosphate isomerase RpiB
VDLIEEFLAAEFSQAERHLRRLNKVTLLEMDWKNNSKSKRND